MRNFLRRLMSDEGGATAIEYGLIIALVFLVMLSALVAFGSTGSGIINGAMAAIRAAMGG